MGYKMDITYIYNKLKKYNNYYLSNYVNKKVNNAKDNQYYYLYLLYHNLYDNKYEENGKIYLDIPEATNIFINGNSICRKYYQKIHSKITKHLQTENNLKKCVLYQEYKIFYNTFKMARVRLYNIIKNLKTSLSFIDMLESKEPIQLSLPIEEKEEVVVDNSLQVEIDNKRKEIEELEMLLKLSNKHGFNLIKKEI